MRTFLGATSRFQCIACVISALVVVVASILPERSGQAGQPSLAAETVRCLSLQVFIRGDSKLCQEAVKFAKTFVESREGICLQVVDVKQDEEALTRYWQLVRRFRVAEPRVPAFYACDRLRIGFESAAKSAAGVEELFAIHAYIRSSCQHCRDAKQFLTGLATRWKGVRIVFHDVDRDQGAMQSMNELARQYGITMPSLPTVSACGHLISGYQTDAITGRQIEDLFLKASTTKTRAAPVDRGPQQPGNTNSHVPRPAATATATENARATASILGAMVLAYRDPLDATEGDEAPPALPEAVPLPDSLPELPPPADEVSSSEETYAPPVEAPEGIDLPWVGYVHVRDLGLPMFTLLIGLVDGFNPCAMWVLVFLLSVLVNVKDRRKIAAIAVTFVTVSGLAYFAFMAAWLNLFMLVGIARPLQIALGILAVVIGTINVKDFFAFKKGVTLSIPESAKPGIYSRVRRIVTTEYLSAAIGLSVVLAVLVNVVELLCTAGLPAVYTQILTMQELPAWKNYAYLGLYNVAYMFDDSLMVAAFVITLSHQKMRETEGRWLKFVSGAVVLALGLAMLLRPDWLQW